jgi:hypothetical protein
LVDAAVADRTFGADDVGVGVEAGTERDVDGDGDERRGGTG